MASSIARHDRVFITGVGTSAKPMEDNWLATARGELHLRKIWMSRESRQLAAGDHVFAVRAGGLRDVIMLAEATGPAVLDPHEWPHASDLQYGFPLRPLVVIDGALTRPIDWLRSPRSGVNEVTDPGRIADLYAAVEHGTRWGDGGEAGPSAKSGRPRPYAAQLRDARNCAARPFDRGAVPRPRATAKAVVDPDTIARLTEKAEQTHFSLLGALHRALCERSWQEVHERPTATDLGGIAPDGTSVLFEAKTIRRENLVSQVRAGLAQLLEYRHSYGPQNAALCLVVDAPLPPFRLEFLASLGISVLAVIDGEIRVARSDVDAITTLVPP